MLVLASRSPRRQEILERAGIPFIVRPAEVDETPLPGEDARAHVLRLATAKAAAIEAGPDDVVLGADTVVVMYLGQIMEESPAADLFAEPLHPYAQALLSASPVPDPTAKRERIILRGEPPSPLNPPSGCRFHTRCPKVFDRCRTEAPELYPVAGDGASHCFLSNDSRGNCLT